MVGVITQKQKNVLALIYDSIKDFGYPPTMAELRESIGVASNQAVINFLKSLEKKGCIKRDEGQARGIKILPLGLKILGKEHIVPVAGVSSAGPFIESLETMVTKWMDLPGQVLENEKIRQADGEFFIIKIYGDSMVNAGIDDGDMLLVKKSAMFKSGDIVVARSDDGTTVKRFIAEPDGRAYLKPENPAYKIIPLFEETYFDGKVILNLTKAGNTNNK